MMLLQCNWISPLLTLNEPFSFDFLSVDLIIGCWLHSFSKGESTISHPEFFIEYWKIAQWLSILHVPSTIQSYLVSRELWALIKTASVQSSVSKKQQYQCQNSCEKSLLRVALASMLILHLMASNSLEFETSLKANEDLRCEMMPRNHSPILPNGNGKYFLRITHRLWWYSALTFAFIFVHSNKFLLDFCCRSFPLSHLYLFALLFAFFSIHFLLKSCSSERQT